MAVDTLLVQQQDGSWLQHDQCIHQQQTRSTRIHFEGLGGQHIELPREHRIVDVQRCGTILVAEHNNCNSSASVCTLARGCLAMGEVHCKMVSVSMSAPHVCGLASNVI